jgi:uncharacterized protein (TIGR00299 family) protein
LRRALHFDCFSGISGDMTVAALLDVGVPEALVQEALESLKLPGRLAVERVRKSGFAAVQVRVERPEEHAHRHLSDILSVVERGKLSAGARRLAKRVFQKLADAEATVHATTPDKVHFHEVGAIDSIYDIVAAAVGIDWLGVETITASPVPTGTGWVQTEHGRLPVPAPAVSHLLIGVPLVAAEIPAELTTPTGAAILVSVVERYVASPNMTIERIGCGAGSRDLESQPNLLRLFLGGLPATAASTADFVWQVETNLDDVTPEIIGFTIDRLQESGVLDVYVTPIQMKKGRPGTLLAVLCTDEQLAAIEHLIFRETGTFGLRKRRVERSTLERTAIEVPTPWGPVKGKLGWNRDVRVFTPEFEDCARLARAHSLPLQTVYRAAVRSYDDQWSDREQAE